MKKSKKICTKTCTYCGIIPLSGEVFCSDKCRNNYKSAIAVNIIKTPIMERMSGLENKKQKEGYLKGLITCLKFDLEDLQKEKE